MKKVKITCDSAADLAHLIQARDISVIPLIVNLGNDEFLDGETIVPDDIYKYVSDKGELPKTAARNKDDFVKFFKTFTDEGFEVVHYSISNEFSMMYAAACKAAAELEGVYVVDSRNLSTGIGLLTLYGCDLKDEGKSAKEIHDLSVARTGSVQASFVVSTMEYLHKGGRCSSLAAVAATALMIKPSIYVQGGKMRVGRKYFGTFGKAVPKYVDEIFKSFSTPHLRRIFITHTSATPEIVQNVRKMLQEAFGFEEILETIAGATVTSHCGKGTLGILYFNDGDKN